MSAWLDPAFWAPAFESRFVRSVLSLERAVVGRVLPAFDGIDREAESLAKEEYDRLGGQPATDQWDMADAAEWAQDAGLAHYEELSDTRQALVNLCTAALFHLVEQQLVFFHRRQVLRPSEEYDASLFSWKIITERLKEFGIDLPAIKRSTGLEELELVANVVKHGDGRSADALRERKAIVLVPELLRGEASLLSEPTGRIDGPLSGDGIYVSVSDFRRYAEIAVAFWREMATAVRATG